MSKFDTAWLNEETGEIHTCKVRLVYQPALLEPRGIKDKPDSKPKYSANGLVPKASNIDVIKKELNAALTGKFGKDWAKNKKLLYPLQKTEDHERLAEYAAEYPYLIKMTANVGYQPFIYNPDTTQFRGQASEIYSGRWAVGAGKFFAYDNVSKGVSFGLNRIQLLDHDEPIAGGRVATASGFEKFEETNSKVAATADSVFADGKKAGGKEMDDEIPF